MRHNIGGWNKRPVAEGMKYCPRCAAEKPLATFPKNRNSPTGRDGYCKPCKAAMASERIVRMRELPDTTAPGRFWPKVNKDAPNGCWLWIGATGKDGYGRFVYRGSVKHAHRVSMILAGFDVPANMDVDHCVCRDRACVNPAHLRVATERQNALENNESPFARNKRKTECKYGHPLTGTNVRVHQGKTARGGVTTNRKCLACYGPGGIRKGKNRKEAP